MVTPRFIRRWKQRFIDWRRGYSDDDLTSAKVKLGLNLIDKSRGETPITYLNKREFKAMIDNDLRPS